MKFCYFLEFMLQLRLILMLGQTFLSRFLLHVCPLANSATMSTLAAGRSDGERTGHLPSYAKAKKMKLLGLHTHGFIHGYSGSVVILRLEGRRFESHSSRHIGTLGKSFTGSCLL